MSRPPQTRDECATRYADGICPWARCRHNLLVEVSRSGALTFAAPTRPITPRRRRGRPPKLASGPAPRAPEAPRYARRFDPHSDPEEFARACEALVAWWFDWEIPTCSLWWANYHAGNGAEYDVIGDLIAISRERARQIAESAILTMAGVLPADGVADDDT